MRRYAFALATLVLLNAGPALAHAHLHGSTPANRSTVSQAPDHLLLQFNEPVRLTALNLQAGGGTRSKLGPLPAAARKEFSIPLPALAPGAYTVRWRVASDDGHIMSDTLTFTIR